MDPKHGSCSSAASTREADVYLFRGPYLDVSAVRPHAPEAGAFVDGENGVSDARLIQILDGLSEAAVGAAIPAWLRPAEL